MAVYASCKFFLWLILCNKLFRLPHNKPVGTIKCVWEAGCMQSCQSCNLYRVATVVYPIFTSSSLLSSEVFSDENTARCTSFMTSIRRALMGVVLPEPVLTPKRLEVPLWQIQLVFLVLTVFTLIWASWSSEGRWYLESQLSIDIDILVSLCQPFSCEL